MLGGDKKNVAYLESRIQELEDDLGVANERITELECEVEDLEEEAVDYDELRTLVDDLDAAYCSAENAESEASDARLALDEAIGKLRDISNY